MRQIVSRAAVFGTLVTFIGCGGAGDATTSPVVKTCAQDPTQSKCVVAVDPDSTLRIVAAKSSRYIGNIAGSTFGQASSNALLAKEFNIVTPENALKMDAVRPSRATFSFTTPDAIYAFASANGMKMRGHTLVWHGQVPAWLSGGGFSGDTLLAIMQDHITRVMTHFKGQIYAWDVVNEALADDGSRRASPWSPIGRKYIEEAFKAARAADPGALLFYNDYSLEFPGPKQDSAFAMIQDFKARQIPIDGIGFQSHFQVSTGGNGVPSQATMAATISRFAALNLKVHLTELDIRIPTSAGSTETSAQTSGFSNVVSACRSVTACEAIVIWGLDDGHSWIPGTFPGYGSATLFDAALNRKATYTAVKASL